MAKTAPKIKQGKSGERGSIPAIIEDNKRGVFISLTLDTRSNPISKCVPQNKSTWIPIAVRVTYATRTVYFRTGTKVTPQMYEALCKAKTSEDLSRLKKEYERIDKAIDELLNEDEFSITKLQERCSKRSVSNKILLVELWHTFGEEKDTANTRGQYRSALRSFIAFNKCEGKDASIFLVRDVTESMVKGWDEHMKNHSKRKDGKGCSADTRSMYLRALRSVLGEAQRRDIIRKIPKIDIPKGNRREDNFVSVADIIRLRDFTAPEEWGDEKKDTTRKYIDMWLCLYMLNGCNTIDMAKMVWSDAFKYENELTFIRSKTNSDNRENGSTATIRIPIIPELAVMLDKYASPYCEGKRIFPFIIGENAPTEAQVADRVHDFNARMRNALKDVCEVLRMRPITAQYARNSFTTTLTHHGISDVYIDQAVGHSAGNKVLRGYQGKFSPKKRYKFNTLLFIDPEDDE